MINKRRKDALFHFWRGYLLIEIRGNALERFITQVIEQGITIWDIVKIRKDYYQARIKLDDFNKLRPIVRRRMCRVRIRSKEGWPFCLRKAAGRSFLLIGLLLFYLVFWLGSSFLWFIEIKGLDNLPEKAIYSFLAQEGVKQGVAKKQVELGKIQEKLLQSFPEIIWAKLEWQGTKLYLELVEKKRVSEVQQGHLIAAKDGIIKEIIVLKGQAVVREGETVTAGQPLVLKGENQQARGIVRASVWYEASAQAKLHLEELIYTGEKKVNWGLKIGRQIFWFFRKQPSFSAYQRQLTLKKVSLWRNIGIPLEIIKEEYQEIKYLQAERSQDLTLFLAKEEAWLKILDELDSGAVIENIIVQNIASQDPNVLGVKILLQTEEDIAVLGGYQ